MSSCGPAFFSTASAPPPPPATPMDAYLSGMLFAYGLKRVLGAYSGPLVRVRRSSDNAEQDIGFITGGGIDTASLLIFCGVGSGYVTKWYDQLLTVDAVQATTSEQPMIVSSGTYLGFIQFDGVDDFMVSHTPAVVALSFGAVVRLPSPPSSGSASYVTHQGLGPGINGLTWQYQHSDGNVNCYAFTGGSSYAHTAASFATADTTSIAIFDRANYPTQYYSDGALRNLTADIVGSPTSDSFTDNDINIGNFSGQPGAFQYQELVCWVVNQASNYFGIFGAL